MATRKIKDAKDLSTNELIYFKGHAKATYMSDGRNVEEAIRQIGTGGGGGGSVYKWRWNTEMTGTFTEEEFKSIKNADTIYISVNVAGMEVTYYVDTKWEIENTLQIGSSVLVLEDDTSSSFVASLQNIAFTFDNTSKIWSALVGGAELISNEQLTSALEGKQDTIEDLEEIRQGAAKGNTALQKDAIFRWDIPINDEGDAIVSGELTEEEYNGFMNSDVVIVNGVLAMKEDSMFVISIISGDVVVLFVIGVGIDDNGKYRYGIIERITEIPTKTSQLENDSDFVSSDNLRTINGQSIVGSGDIEIGGSITEDQLMWTKAEGEAGVRLKGTNGTATGNLAISAGDDKTASDGTPFASVASGDHAVAFGYGNTCAGRTTLAQGLYNIVNGKDAVAFGQRNVVNGDQAFAAGQQNEVLARIALAIGYKNKATNTDSIAIGYQNTSSGSASVAMGDTCEASGTSSTAMGYKTKATGAYSSTFGENTQATNEGEVAMGVYNKSTTSTDASEQTAFSFGIGTSDTNRANALEIKKNGDVYIGDKLLSVAYPRITTDLAEAVLQPNTVTEWLSPITFPELTLSFSEAPQGFSSEFVVMFSVGADGVQLIVPDGVVWADGVLPAMTNGKTYEISFVDNLATFLEF